MGWLGPVNNETEILQKYSAITLGGSKRLVFVGSLGTSSIFRIHAPNVTIRA
jgi:hypothetical protein